MAPGGRRASSCESWYTWQDKDITEMGLDSSVAMRESRTGPVLGARVRHSPGGARQDVETSRNGWLQTLSHW